MYSDVLVPTDGTAEVDRAADHAFTIADRFDATVHALYVVVTEESPAIAGSTATLLEASTDQGEEATAAIADAAREQGLDCETEVVVGTPAREILTYIDDHGIDLTVMSTHARSGVKRFLTGSVTESVIRQGDGPVLAVHRD